MRALLAALFGALVFSACPNPMPQPAPEEEEPFDGESMSGVIPTFDRDNELDAGVFIIDAGLVTVETRCCATNFSISDEEPSDATGTLFGQTASLQTGIPLQRVDAGWSASACLTLNSSTLYWYRFTWDGGQVDAGGVDLPDGGYEIVIETVTVTRDRSSDREPGVDEATGRKNYYRDVSSCDGLDGGVPP